MATVSHEPARVAQEKRTWASQLAIREMWASLTIIVMWLAVLFDAVYGSKSSARPLVETARPFRRRLPSRCSHSSARGSSHDTASGLSGRATEISRTLG